MPRGRRNRPLSGAYPQRTDLAQRRAQPVRAPTGLPYGDRKALEDAQRALPLPDISSEAPAPQTLPVPPPGVLGPLDRPTERPNEPLTAGLSIGEGPGPEAVRYGPGPSEDDIILGRLLALHRMYPSSDLAELISWYLARM
jgi:hypothetical protein